MPTAQQFQLGPEEIYGTNYAITDIRGNAYFGYIIALTNSTLYPTFTDAANHEYGGASNIWEGPNATPYVWPYAETYYDDNLGGAGFNASILESNEYATISINWTDAVDGSYLEILSLSNHSFNGGTLSFDGNYLNVDIENPSTLYRYYYGFIFAYRNTSGTTCYPMCRWILDQPFDTQTDGILSVKFPKTLMVHPNSDPANNMFSWDDVSYWYFGDEPSMPINWNLEARLVNDTFDMSTSAHLPTRTDKWTAVTNAAVTGASAYVFTEGTSSDLDRPSYVYNGTYTGLEGKQSAISGMSFGSPTAGQTVNGLVIYVNTVGTTFWPVAYLPMTPFVTDGNPVSISMNYIFCANKWNE